MILDITYPCTISSTQKDKQKRREGNKHTMLGLVILLENKRTAGQSDDLFGKAKSRVKQRTHNDY